MSMLQLVTAATKLPVSLAEVKDHLNLPHAETDDDAKLDQMIRAAVQDAEKVHASGLAMTTQTWTENLCNWPANSEIVLRKSPVQSVTTVKYLDVDGVLQTLSSALYQTNLIPQPPWSARILPAKGETWPTLQTEVYNPVQVTYVAGYGDSFNDVPDEVRLELLELVAGRYENREPLAMPAGGLATLSNYRVNWF